MDDIPLVALKLDAHLLFKVLLDRQHLPVAFISRFFDLVASKSNCSRETSSVVRNLNINNDLRKNN